MTEEAGNVLYAPQEAVPPADFHPLAEVIGEPGIPLGIDPQQFLVIPSGPDGNILYRSWVLCAHRQHLPYGYLVQCRGHPIEGSGEKTVGNFQGPAGGREVFGKMDFVGHGGSMRVLMKTATHPLL